MSARRILDLAAKLLAKGATPTQAINEACEKVSVSPAAKEQARTTFYVALRRVQEEG